MVGPALGSPPSLVGPSSLASGENILAAIKTLDKVSKSPNDQVHTTTDSYGQQNRAIKLLSGTGTEDALASLARYVTRGQSGPLESNNRDLFATIHRFDY